MIFSFRYIIFSQKQNMHVEKTINYEQIGLRTYSRKDYLLLKEKQKKKQKPKYMIKVVKLLTTSYDKSKRLISKIQRLGKDDIQTAYNLSSYGVDANPPKDLQAVHLITGENGESVIVGYINKNLIAEKGSHRLFSENNYLHLRQSGQIEIGGTGDHMIRYQGLDNGLQTFITNLNLELVAIAAGIASAGGTYTATPQSMDISASKISEIETT